MFNPFKRFVEKSMKYALETLEYFRTETLRNVRQVAKNTLVGLTLSAVLATTMLPNPAIANPSYAPVQQSPVVASQMYEAPGSLDMVVAQVAKQQNPILVYVDGKLVNFPDQKPYVDSNSRTLVPVRFVSEALGAKVDWNGGKQEVGIDHQAKQKDVVLWVGRKDYQVNGKTAQMDTQAVLTSQARVMVPLRFVSEALGAEVHWQVVSGNGVVHTFTLGQSKEEVQAIMNRIKNEIEGGVVNPAPVQPPATKENNYGFPSMSENIRDYGFSGVLYYKNRMTTVIEFEDPSYNPAKIREELNKAITGAGYTEAQAKEVIDYALSKTDREVALGESFFMDGTARVYVGSAVGANTIRVTIQR